MCVWTCKQKISLFTNIVVRKCLSVFAISGSIAMTLPTLAPCLSLSHTLTDNTVNGTVVFSFV